MKITPPETDNELFVRLRAGDESAFVALYRRRQGAIYRFVLHMSRSPAVAEDVTQEVFVALLRDACGYDPDRGTLSGYLFGIARKLLLRQIERGRVDVPLESDSEDAAVAELAVAGNALEDLTHREGIEGLRRAVGTLPRRYREVVVLCDLEEVDYADAARALGCPIGTVRSRLHRARALLLDKLNRECHPGPNVSALNPIRCSI
jgi:RNA polymerase sigma-70 factor (ECF subfamily)